MQTVKQPGPRPSDKWIPWYIVLFFVVMVCALAPMGYLAVHTLPGTVTDNAYEEGLAYNKAIAAGAQAQALGWQGVIALDTNEASSDIQASYMLHDAQGAAIDDAAVHLWLVRPAQSGKDRDVALVSQGGGRYSASVSLPEHGLWDARVSATRGNDNFQSEKRVVVP